MPWLLKVPEEILLGFHGIVATSDTAVIDQSHKVFDLAGTLIRKRIRPASLIKLNLPELTIRSQMYPVYNTFYSRKRLSP